jgi:hypothetical protein
MAVNRAGDADHGEGNGGTGYDLIGARANCEKSEEAGGKHSCHCGRA